MVIMDKYFMIPCSLLGVRGINLCSSFCYILSNKSGAGDPQSSQGGSTHVKVTFVLRMFVIEDSDGVPVTTES